MPFGFLCILFLTLPFLLCGEEDCSPILISVKEAELIAMGNNPRLEQAALAAERDYWIYRETLGRIFPQVNYRMQRYQSSSLRTLEKERNRARCDLEKQIRQLGTCTSEKDLTEQERQILKDVDLYNRFTSILRLDQALLEVPLYFNIESADWIRVASFYNYMEELIQTLLRIRLAHFRILVNKKLIAIQQESLDLYKDAYQKERIRSDYGESTEFEYARNRLAYTNTLNLYYRAVNDLQIAKDEWIRILGIQPTEGQEYDILEKEFPLEEVTLIKELLSRLRESPQQILVGIITCLEEFKWETTALQIRPLLQRAVAERNSAKSLVRSAQGEYFPRIGFFATYNIEYPPEAFGTNRSFMEVGFNLNWTIFDGLSRESRIQRFRKEKQIRDSVVKENYYDIQLEVRDASELLQQSLYALKAAEDGQQLAQKGIDMALEGYNLGLFTSLDYRDMVQSFIRAKSDLAQSGFGVMAGYFQLIASIGFADFDAGAQLLTCECEN